MGYELKTVETPDDWAAMHAIRREVLFAPERHQTQYDENHADDRAPANTPYLLVLDGKPVGVARLDAHGDFGIIRLVAISKAEQGRGHGRALERLIEEQARNRGIRTLRLNSAPDAVGFYEKASWRRALWDPSELTGIASNCVQMEKALA
jgi:GNAT superfamily N-acetyltransferase